MIARNERVYFVSRSMKEIAAIQKGRRIPPYHVPGHLLHPALVWVNGDANLRALRNAHPGARSDPVRVRDVDRRDVATNMANELIVAHRRFRNVSARSAGS